ncbi:peptidoglycan-binding domain-containing protein [Ralstonia pseudosolanacearum]|uniref:peptidoglycan-binding domain-containing protein n=1 Tax=Ralstonia pseudosolanacearum TaxID=1310165 RepID=UPI0008FC3209|nr:peptidoglycan-binding domain-containing protein [Ralstonia pseudosolanacearum]AVV67612.1 peptidoglycan-binding protein [Ralstonia solanacearum OE1-1]AXV75240.1 hypothetical protein CJO75_23300 [Ralstonia solanacearum]AXW41196.1 hypothetical protein CJO89_23885 [Ralstonia solanacearum]AXW73992.1 hypothetical protein CJO96_23190 [Ralstonia solanacearum]QKL94333.1 peptidoglycan-binding protein [Ralstonia solanacearum]
MFPHKLLAVHTEPGLAIHPLLSAFRASDGSFGAETESRVRAFQRRNTLVPDGIAGSQELDGS